MAAKGPSSNSGHLLWTQTVGSLGCDPLGSYKEGGKKLHRSELNVLWVAARKVWLVFCRTHDIALRILVAGRDSSTAQSIPQSAIGCSAWNNKKVESIGKREAEASPT